MANTRSGRKENTKSQCSKTVDNKEETEKNGGNTRTRTEDQENNEKTKTQEMNEEQKEKMKEDDTLRGTKSIKGKKTKKE
ncbi:unnamed protein product [Caenorhabditis nigoni]|uniref:Uncharacterized protein n=1 Tax=Caenorhabditis nigoni TaxID=1611254 RepID=A0A2G5U9W6_9PELO|nr:hypothetical protein B9Z55_015382 [Caenorhabditis nigoni]